MAPRSRTGSSTKEKDAMDNRRHLLRLIVTASAACGVFLNIIAIANIDHLTYGRRAPKQLMSWAFLPLLGSLAWDIGHILSDGLHPGLQGSGDALAFLGFVAITVTNGIIAKDLTRRNYWGKIDAYMLLAYNSFPWIICAGMHFCLAVHSLLRTVDIHKLPKIKIEWPEAGIALLADDEAYHDVVEEAQSKKKGAIDGEDDEENSPLLGSS